MMESDAPSPETPAPKDTRKQLGTLGEAETAAFLENHGYRVIDANVRPLGGRRRGEIDIVAWHGDYLVFIEVKTRRSGSVARPTPAEAVNWRKRRQLVHLANSYIARYRLDDVPCRFDVVEVLRIAESLSFNLIENAFDGGDV